MLRLQSCVIFSSDKDGVLDIGYRYAGSSRTNPGAGFLRIFKVAFVRLF